MNDMVQSVSEDQRIAQLVATGMTPERAELKLREVQRRRETRASFISPPGALGLPKLLDYKRIKHEIVDSVFDFEPVYDRCFVYQIGLETDIIEGTGGLVMPESTKEWMALTAPKGILIAAGLRAMDNLLSNGMNIGHTVVFNQSTPFRFPMGNVLGKAQNCLVVRDGEICGSLELRRAQREGLCKREMRVTKDEYGNEVFEHVFLDEHGKLWQPRSPWIGDDQ